MSVLAGERKKSLSDDSHTSEAELHAEHPNIKEGWQELQDVKRKIALAKMEACKAVDEKFADELSGAETNYTMLMTLSR